MTDFFLRHIAQLATPVGRQAKRGAEMKDLQLVADAAIWAQDGTIRAAGRDADVMAEAQAAGVREAEMQDAAGKTAVPGFVDPHTHFLFAGARAEEFDDRLAGVPYLELLQRGGGIVSTMQATRAAGEDELYAIGRRTLADMLTLGVTTVEGKSGYGLDLKTELRLLRVMQRLDHDLPTSVVRTYLGAHAVPPEYQGRQGDYVDFIIETVLPRVAAEHLATFVDVFCETGVFTNEESERILRAAQAKGLLAKLHADEMSSTGGAGLACRLGAVSADHLLSISDADIGALGESKTVAVLLPATAFCMRKPYAPARRMMEAGAAVALASDYNPGSCYTYSVPLIFGLAVIAMHMTAAEALTAMTLNAAAAVGRAAAIGSIEPGKRADIVLLDAPDYRFLAYKTGLNLVERVYCGGALSHQHP
jgi:imidazolonepropionase